MRSSPLSLAVDVAVGAIRGGFKATGKLAAALVKGAQLKVYAGAPHAAATTHADQVNADPPAFFMS
ncbi:hypothetical protein [Pandoraea apista]|uniref:Arylesterase n=1 Tax=Pandoraea apista TaxID=93218 RepID=A0A5E5P2H2_9BURK|nr:hypothetical protein [Pandoraea apista]VVG70896.1 arylesterase [Pandoraea apista]